MAAEEDDFGRHAARREDPGVFQPLVQAGYGPPSYMSWNRTCAFEL